MIPTLTNPLGISPAYGRRLQYLESTGTQYIDTGVKPDFAGGDSVEISYFRADYTGQMPCVCGSREITLRNGFHLLANNYAVYGSDGYKTYGVDQGFPVTQANCTIAVNDNYVVINGTQRISMPYRVTCSLAMTLFAMRHGISILVYYSGMRLYEWKYWRNGTLAQHLIPVLDRSSVPCLYDTISRTLKYNAGTGTFNYA